MVRRVQRVAYQHSVVALGIQLAIGFELQLVRTQYPATLERQGLVKVHGLWCGCECHVNFNLAKTQAFGMTCLAEFIKAPASGGKSALLFSISKRIFASALFLLTMTRCLLIHLLVWCVFCLILVHFSFRRFYALF